MMKKFSSKVLMMALAVVTLFAACDSEDIENPLGGNGPEVNVSISPEQDVYAEGDVIDIVISFSGSNGLVGATLLAETGSGSAIDLSAFDGITYDQSTAENTLDLNAFAVAGESSGTITVDGLQIPAGLEGDDLVFTAELEDSEGNVADGTVTISTEVALTSFSGQLLAAPLGEGNSETFFSTSTGETYSMNEVNGTTAPISAEIDFGYFYGQSREATLANPANYPLPDYGQAAWSTRNNTALRYTDLTESQFNEANIGTIDDAFENGTADDTNTGMVVQLSIGDVIAFRTDADKEGGAKTGLLLVTAIEPGIGVGDNITFDIVMEL